MNPALGAMINSTTGKPGSLRDSHLISSEGSLYPRVEAWNVFSFLMAMLPDLGVVSHSSSPLNHHVADDRSQPKEMFCVMPIMCVKGVAADRVDSQGIFKCPVYKTEQRGPTFVFCAQLKTKSPPGRWVLAGVALIMDVA